MGKHLPVGKENAKEDYYEFSKNIHAYDEKITCLLRSPGGSMENIFHNEVVNGSTVYTFCSSM